MSLPNYQIKVFDSDSGATLNILDSASWTSLRYTRYINDIGKMVMVVPYSDVLYQVFDWDNFVEIKRTHPETGLVALEDTYLVRSKHRFWEDKFEWLVIGGLSLNHLLARRVINPADDGAATDGYSRKSGAADTVMRGYVREQAGDLASVARRTPGLSVPAVAGTGTSINKVYRYDNLFNAMQEMAYASGMDFQVVRTSLYYTEVRIAVIGTDRTRTANIGDRLPWLGLSPSRGNLNNPSLDIDRSDEQNYIYVLGQGQGEKRIVYQQAGDTSGSQFNRIEFVKDQRNVEKTDTAGLVTAATTEINKNKYKYEFTFELAEGNGGSTYHKDWELGDKATVIWNNTLTDLRIVGVEIEADDSGEFIDVEVETKYV